MAKYQWYMTAMDVSHRLFLYTLLGGSLYMVGGFAYTSFVTSSQNKKKIEEYVDEHKKEQAVLELPKN
ncbi:Cox14p ASCRUDRAFT_31250 [Ascoidea rubescens DSM 1968]|uniref:Cytochrome c oxidase assembly protein COX14 n=1 Tax=Ascoidea rubescens DSM 1968 TaxID=1344418 RepID=A0A1D2VMT6_9ASCO|nr:hypothetical protein ASCRUDRAFT_31250 [Ascoidea rubescens DSM 1968]ODV62877.1 hypothetical protein ASCRUDRAFT_31250 [Ascoidea rubescens DSM 1968]